ncbi:hypothetical protein ABBQ32_009348 [Trebouxia sp. C0010 RCD-2024]
MQSPFLLNFDEHPRSLINVDVVCKLPAADTFVGRVKDSVLRARESLSHAQAHMCETADAKRRAEAFEEYLDTLEPQDRPAARVGKPTPLTASESQVIPSGTTVAKVPAKRGRPRKQRASVDATVQNADAPRPPRGRPRKHS